jgi:hypothetical protein
MDERNKIIHVLPFIASQGGIAPKIEKRVKEGKNKCIIGFLWVP